YCFGPVLSSRINVSCTRAVGCRVWPGCSALNWSCAIRRSSLYASSINSERLLGLESGERSVNDLNTLRDIEGCSFRPSRALSWNAQSASRKDSPLAYFRTLVGRSAPLRCNEISQAAGL